MSYTNPNKAERQRKEQDELINRMKQSTGVGSAEGKDSSSNNNKFVVTEDTTNTYDYYATKTNDNIREALRTSERTNDIGSGVLGSLARQRETIQHATAGAEGASRQIGEAGRTISEIRWMVYKEWAVKGGIILILVILIVLVFYRKFIK